MKRAVLTALLTLAMAGTAEAMPAAKLLQVADPHPLTAHTAMTVAQRFYDEFGGYRRANSRVIHIQVFDYQPVNYEDGATGGGVFVSTLTVKRRRDGTLTAYDSLFSDKPIVVR